MNPIHTLKNVFQNIGRSLSRLPMVVKIIILLLIIGGGYVAYKQVKGTKSAAVSYQTTEAQKGTLIVSVSSSGQVTTANSGSISTNASGVVSKILVKNGDSVKAGAVIATLDLDQQGKQKYAEAQAQYLSAKNNVTTAQYTMNSLKSELFTNWDKYYQMTQDDTYSDPNSSNRLSPIFIEAQENWYAAEAKYKNQQNVITQAQTSLSSAAISLAESSPNITAPISGTVTGLSLQPGSVLTEQTNTSGTTSSQKVASIVTAATPNVSVNLTEVDVPSVKVGDKATVTLDSFPTKTFTGTVISIDTVGSVSSNVTTYPAVIKLDNQEDDIFSNMTAQANIITQTKDNVLLVPSSAVKTTNGQSTVTVLKNGQPQIVAVETGLTSDTQTEITSGLAEGDQVVTNPTATTNTTTGAVTTTSPFSGLGGGGGAVRFAR